MEGYWGDESRMVDWAQNVVGALNALLENFGMWRRGRSDMNVLAVIT